MKKLRKTFILVLLLPLMTGLFACRTTQTSSQSADDQDSTVPLRINADQENAEELVPPFLWSPSRRRAVASYYYLVGEYMSLERRPDKAQDVLEASYNLDPNPFLAAKYISAKAMTTPASELLADARKMILLYPHSSELHFLYGKLLAQAGLTEQAEKELEQALDLEKSRAEYYIVLIGLHRSNKDLAKAVAVAESFCNYVPSSDTAWRILAKLYLQQAQHAKAVTAAEKAYQLNAHNPENILVYALALESNKELHKAAAFLEQLYRINPDQEVLMQHMIELYRNIGNLEESLSLLNEMSRLNKQGERPGITLQKAVILWELQRYDEAAQLIISVQEKFPDSDRLLYMRGLAHEKLQQFDEAARIYQQIPHNSPYFQDSIIRQIGLLTSQKKFTDAEKLLTKSLEELGDEAHWRLFAMGASIFAEQKNYLKARNLANQGFQRYPDEIYLLFLRGVYEEKLKLIDACVKTMQEVITRQPDFDAALNFLGYLWVERNENLEEAEKLIKRAVSLKPEDGYYLDSLGWLYYQKGQYDKALEYLQKANKLAPNEGVILEHIAAVYQKLNKPLEAIKYYKQALSTNIDEDLRKKIESNLAQLPKTEN